MTNTDFEAPHIAGKRAFDIAASAAGLTLLAPAMAVIGILVRRTSPGPAIYRAERVGRGGQLFTMYKFRSMYLQDSPGQAHTTGFNDPRVTPLGRILRQYKLDELPQLWNVLRGDMSLVGPRPEVADCVDLYTDEQRHILGVRPGLTDLASVEFVDLASVVGESEDPHAVYLEQVFQRKNDLRLEYARGASWAMDLKILLRTLTSLIRRDGNDG